MKRPFIYSYNADPETAGKCCPPTDRSCSGREEVRYYVPYPDTEANNGDG